VKKVRRAARSPAPVSPARRAMTVIAIALDNWVMKLDLRPVNRLTLNHHPAQKDITDMAFDLGQDNTIAIAHIATGLRDYAAASVFIQAALWDIQGYKQYNPYS